MPFDYEFNDATGVENNKGYMFKPGVKYSYFSASDSRPITFRILPAFPSHDGALSEEEKESSYVPAVTMVSGKPEVAYWMNTVLLSRSFLKGANPVISRRSIVEFNSDGTLVKQEDPLSQVMEYIRAYDAQWGYVAHDIGEWGSKDRQVAKLPFPRKEYLMNVLTLDDEKPGVKVCVIKSKMAVDCLLSRRPGSEGAAIEQTERELTQEEIDQDPSCIFRFGDITDPNGAPVFHYMKGLSEDRGRKVYRINVVYDTDAATGRQRVTRMPLTAEQMVQRQDLEHLETFVNIPDPEEQVAQIVERCCGRNKDGFHEYDMLRAALPDYAYLIPPAPPAPGAVGVVQGFTAQQTQPVQQVKAAQPAQSAKPAQQAQQRFTPSARPAQRFTPQKTAQAQPQAKPVQSQVKPVQTDAPAGKWTDPANPVEDVPGEAFDQNAWLEELVNEDGNGNG